MFDDSKSKDDEAENRLFLGDFLADAGPLLGREPFFEGCGDMSP